MTFGEGGSAPSFTVLAMLSVVVAAKPIRRIRPICLPPPASVGCRDIQRSDQRAVGEARAKNSITSLVFTKLCSEQEGQEAQLRFVEPQFVFHADADDRPYLLTYINQARRRR